MIDPNLYIAEAKSCLERIDLTRPATLVDLQVSRIRLAEAGEYLRLAYAELLAAQPTTSARDLIFVLLDGGLCAHLPSSSLHHSMAPRHTGEPEVDSPCRA